MGGRASRSGLAGLCLRFTHVLSLSYNRHCAGRRVIPIGTVPPLSPFVAAIHCDSGPGSGPGRSPRRSPPTAWNWRGRGGAHRPACGLIHSRPAPAAVDRPARIPTGREPRRSPVHARQRYRRKCWCGATIRERPYAADKVRRPQVGCARYMPGQDSTEDVSLVRRAQSNPLRSRERRFESCRGHCSKT